MTTNLIWIIFFSLISFSCTIKDYEHCKKENERLKSIIDSLNSSFEKEKFSTIVINPHPHKTIFEKDSLNLFIGLTYYRPDLENDFHTYITQNEDSLELFFNSPDTFKQPQTITQNSSLEDNIIEINIEQLKRGQNYLGGYLQLNHLGKIKYLPFRYTFTVK